MGGLFLRKKFIKWSKFIVNVTNDFNKLTDYLLYSIKEIKVNNLGNSIFSKHNLIHQQISKTQIKIRFTQIAPRYFVEAIFFSSIALFLIYVGSDQNEISSEILSSIAFIVVAGMRALPLVNQIMISYNGIKAGSGSGIQILTHLKKLSSSKSKSSKKYISKKFLDKNDILTFENVSFSFGKNKVISNLSFNLQAGEIVLFFGPSGSGKSTALDLILGLREVNSGIVNVKKNLNFYYVSQHPFFPSCSVSDYFSALTPNTNWKNVSKVLKQLNLNFLADNPDYYLGEAASNLSGGQRQLLALSSIIIREPDVIVFDETTSGLDSENELKFLDIVKNNFSKSLVLMISHRDTSKDIASKIINFPC